MLFISTNHKMAQEYPQRVLVGNFIWNTQITPVVGECDILYARSEPNQANSLRLPFSEQQEVQNVYWPTSLSNTSPITTRIPHN